jgi:hypothetical protein
MEEKNTQLQDSQENHSLRAYERFIDSEMTL